jgi:hypothetical protein
MGAAQFPQKESDGSAGVPHLRQGGQVSARATPAAPGRVTGTPLADRAPEYAEMRAEAVSAFPQSRQYRAEGSLSWPQNAHGVLAGAGVGDGDEEEGGAEDTITHELPSCKTA